MKRSRAPSSRVVSVPKSTHYVNWIRLFFALPSTLTSSPGNNSAVLQQALQPHKTSEGQVLLTTSHKVHSASREESECFILYIVYMCDSVCVCVCVCVCAAAGAGAQRMTACLWRAETRTLWSRSPSLLPPSCHCASGILLGLSPPRPLPLKAATQEIESCFQRKTREERRAQTPREEGVCEERVMERF